MTDNKLRGLRILVTRPKPQGEALCQRIARLGGEPYYLPTIEYAPPKQPIEEQVTEWNQLDWAVFISAEAVHRCAPALQQSKFDGGSQVKIAAVGASTADALQQWNVPVSAFPVQEWSSEALLALPEFQVIDGQKIALVQGEGGRTVLADTLTARGASIIPIIAYRRCLPTTIDMPYYRDLLQRGSIDVLVCASGESLQNLITLFGKHDLPQLRQIPLVIISQRLLALAKELHFNTVFLAQNASHDAIISTLESIVRSSV